MYALFFPSKNCCISAHSMFTCTSTCGGELFYFMMCIEGRKKASTEKSCVQCLLLLLPPTPCTVVGWVFRLLDHQYRFCCCCFFGLAVALLLLPSRIFFIGRFADVVVAAVRRPENFFVVKKKKALRVLCVLLCIFSCFNFFKTQLSSFHFLSLALFHFSKNVSYRWIATLRRLGCNLFFVACWFFRFKSFSWETLHQIYIEFFFIYFLIIFRRRLQCAAARMVWRCKCCDTSHSRSEGRGDLLWHTLGRFNGETGNSRLWQRKWTRKKLFN